MIDLYCERRGPGLWAEPLNASTNLAFLAAAAAAWLLARRLGDRSAGVAVLIALATAVGLGSAAFHTFATPWAQAADVIPILAFQVAFLWLYLRESISLSTPTATALTAVYLIVSLSTRALPPLLNGSITYVPTLAVLAGMAVYHYWSRQPGRILLPIALAVFAAALTFRTIDSAVCPHIPFGTHFLWHLLNGVLLYLAMRTMIVKHATRPTEVAPSEIR